MQDVALNLFYHSISSRAHQKKEQSLTTTPAGCQGLFFSVYTQLSFSWKVNKFVHKSKK